jgi:Domain of unknown function (DUF3819)
VHGKDLSTNSLFCFLCDVCCLTDDAFLQEPLRGALTSNLRTMLQSLNSNNDCNEQIVQILITDHLDLGCALIESVATRKVLNLAFFFWYMKLLVGFRRVMFHIS